MEIQPEKVPRKERKRKEVIPVTPVKWRQFRMNEALTQEICHGHFGARKNQLNIMTVDLEDYFCAHNLSQAVPREKWDRQPLRIIECTRSLLQLFETHRVKATFFVLGWIAEKVPDLISEIADRGHVIASHGYSLRLYPYRLLRCLFKKWNQNLRTYR